ncbi:protein lin-54 homolog isoform X2 [Culicoides brevitarsis]|uniref:protein lin-54 homolog isoform X2 n=1 Tax=Culicoides brevitarsis TaxID=469753 RepID=UPI00307B1334
MDMEEEHTTTMHGEDLDDLIQYEEVEYEYEEVGDEDYQIETNMEEEHLEYEEEPETIPKVVHIQQQSPARQQIVRNAQGQIMIVQSAPQPVSIKIESQPQSGGIQIVRKSAPQVVSTPQQRVVTQIISPQASSSAKYVLKQSGGQQYFVAAKDEPMETTTITRQYVPQNRGNVTITRTTNAGNQSSPTILNSKVVQKPAPPQITVKQIRSPPLATQTRTILNKSASPNAQRVLLNQQSSSGTLQAVNIPGKGVQYVRVLNSQAPSNVAIQPRTIQSSPKKIINSTLSPTNAGANRVLVPGKTSGTYTLVQAGGSQVRQDRVLRPVQTVVKREHSSPQKLIAVVKKEKDPSKMTPQKSGEKVTRTTVLTTSQLNQLKGVNIIPGSNSKTKIVMLPSDYMEQLRELQAKQPDKKLMPRTIITTNSARKIKREKFEDEEGNKKRRCNCTKSQCLKLYCDCFAAGEFCGDCNCKDCFNTVDHEDDRQKAVRQCLERNPYAFKPKIKDTETLRLHHKGCNCKRSGCLKNYCECYEAKVTCSGICKCIGCHNFDPAMAEEKEAAERELQREKQAMKRAAHEQNDKNAANNKHPFNFMTPDVIEATVQCMIAQAEECQKREMDPTTSEKMILEEFGRCLVEIIDFSTKNE